MLLERLARLRPSLCSGLRRGKGGFGATIAVMSLSLGAVALSIAASSAALGYSESVDAEISRAQATLDAKACADSVTLIRAKDIFASGDVDIQELHCHVSL